jgi:hypothetical protein
VSAAGPWGRLPYQVARPQYGAGCPDAQAAASGSLLPGTPRGAQTGRPRASTGLSGPAGRRERACRQPRPGPPHPTSSPPTHRWPASCSRGRTAPPPAIQGESAGVGSRCCVQRFFCWGGRGAGAAGARAAARPVSRTHAGDAAAGAQGLGAGGQGGSAGGPQHPPAAGRKSHLLQLGGSSLDCGAGLGLHRGRRQGRGGGGDQGIAAATAGGGVGWQVRARVRRAAVPRAARAVRCTAATWPPGRAAGCSAASPGRKPGGRDAIRRPQRQHWDYAAWPACAGGAGGLDSKPPTAMRPTHLSMGRAPSACICKALQGG